MVLDVYVLTGKSREEAAGVLLRVGGVSWAWCSGRRSDPKSGDAARQHSRREAREA